MAPGHARTLSLYLDGRLQPPPEPAAASSAAEAEEEEEVAWMIPIPAAALRQPSADAGRVTHAAASPFVPRGGSGGGGSGGVRVLQAAWHPLSCSHLCVLTSDSRLLLFDARSSLHAPDEALEVPARPDEAVVAFSFASPSAAGWASLAVWFACSDGALFAACPVLPPSRAGCHHLRSLAPELLKTAPTEPAGG